MKKALLLLVTVAVFSTAKGQLLPSIGIDSLPEDTTAICPIPWYLGSFATTGLQVGDTASDFTLFDVNGNSFNLAAALALGKPVLLVSGNYTCPVFRNKIPVINSVVDSFPQVTTAVIYCVEAHPTDTSPYFGYVNTLSQNYADNILYAQPTTYGQRKQIATDMITYTGLNAPVYLDGPCNEWWSWYGPAPNNAYLIDTNGIVFAKHEWFDHFPYDIFCDIDSLLGLPANCNNQSGGSFTANFLSSNQLWGVPGSILVNDAELINTSGTNVNVMLKRTQTIMPAGWATSMCASVCYSTLTDSVLIQIPPGDTQSFHLSFFTDTIPGNALVKVTFRNVDNSLNVFQKTIHASTSPASVNDPAEKTPAVVIYPNPVNDVLQVDANFHWTSAAIFDLTGKQVGYGTTPEIDVASLSPGIYFVRISDANNNYAVTKFVKQ